MKKIMPELPQDTRDLLHELQEWVGCARAVLAIGLPSPKLTAVYEDIVRLGGAAIRALDVRRET